MAVESFQFTPLREGRPLLLWKLYPFREFQFTPLREGRRDVRIIATPHIHFNSRPSARGDGRESRHRQAAERISIHAPPRGATTRPGDDAPRQRISIHAPPRGATVSSSQKVRMKMLFQFTPLREGRRTRRTSPGTADISIHAPPRGATAFLELSFCPLNISIHAPPRGATRVG